MKKFDNILRETYRIINEQVPGNVEGPVPGDDQMGADLGAANPIDSPAEGDQEPTKLTSSAETNLVKILRYALFTCIPDDDFDQHNSNIPAYENINENNAKETLQQIIDILKQYNPEFASLDEVTRSAVDYRSDEETFENLPAI